MAIARQRFHNQRYRSNKQRRKINLLLNRPTTIDTAATNRVTIQNGVQYSDGREGIKGKLQTVQYSTNKSLVHDSSQEVHVKEFRRVQEPQTRLSLCVVKL
jgi:hypothetical protein